MIVNKETALLAKEKGFNGVCYEAFRKEDEEAQRFDGGCCYQTLAYFYTLAPNQFQLWQWLIDEHKLFVLVSPLMNENLSDLKYEVDVIDLSNTMDYANQLLDKLSSNYEQYSYKTNTEAFEVGLQKALEKV